MAKKEIQLPDKFPFSIELTIRKIDLSLDIHVSFASILDLVMEAHLQFLLNHNFTPTNIYGKGVIFADANIAYQGELFYKDIVRIDVGMMNFFEKGFDYVFRLTKTSNGENSPVSIVTIKVLFFDYNTRKTSLVPEDFLKLFAIEKKAITKSSFEDSEFWNLAHKVSLEAYKISQKFPNEEQHHLTARIRKTATSLPLAVKELESKSDREGLLKSYPRVRGYIEELRYYVILANDLGYANSENFLNLLNSFLKTLKELYFEKIQK